MTYQDTHAASPRTIDPHRPINACTPGKRKVCSIAQISTTSTSSINPLLAEIEVSYGTISDNAPANTAVCALISRLGQGGCSTRITDGRHWIAAVGHVWLVLHLKVPVVSGIVVSTDAVLTDCADGRVVVVGRSAVTGGIVGRAGTGHAVGVVVLEEEQRGDEEQEAGIGSINGLWYIRKG